MRPSAKKILTTNLILILILYSVPSCCSENGTTIDQKSKKVYDEINLLKNKVLAVDKTIGDIHVKYWEHVIDGFIVKNNSILLHLDRESTNIINYDKSWTDLEIKLPDLDENLLDLEKYHWKRKVIFPDENDSGFFYNFYEPIDYPLVCWEVRYTDGSTILYDHCNNEIGYGITAPSKGVSLRGWGDTMWRYWRDNARDWFNKWCGKVYNLDRPTVNQISTYIRKPTVDYFYVIAHSDGEPTRFITNEDNVYYTASRLHEDISSRGSMSFSLLCCCEAMKETGPGTLSYELRKGELKDTVTIGFVEMGSGPFYDTYNWQDFMLEKIDEGHSFKEAFDLACAEYPQLYDHVRFVGDENLTLDDISEDNSNKKSKNSPLLQIFKNCPIFSHIRNIFKKCYAHLANIPSRIIFDIWTIKD